MSTTIVTPGLRLGKTSDLQAGPGTYIRDGFIYASTLGTLKQFATPAAAAAEDETDPDPRPTLFVAPRKELSSVPQVGSTVIGKVLRINTRFASVAIMMVDSRPCKEDYLGVIRIQDVRATEKDNVQIYKSFRPGDIVRAQVISLGDARSYYLSTAQNELGVILAQSLAGETLVPVSWETMQCPKTHAIEYRKCAKPY
ncbi:hypothetical protein H4R33_003456 [Dimargaris cristalligena]|uniref:S1 motif domain-containing protein n=1 Tax=Dimargaris cristalligena TaxID=215637 RepID=A0A4P9ZXX5_9FUNG|nr:hypothetical protein H4R33_003456 [Dimargaris cristalligena]RKP38544.1 hypothetical protein BJ085DRAFT_14951 [Dimargaris cristalligena]|eukprot:RKP38544.1 hypothetical protein BJ085DRAFT_14951 [Dimargaris cristalligena]